MKIKFGNLQLDPWQLGSLGPEFTGMDAIVWVSSRQKYTVPYILVGLKGAYDVVVTVENQPRVIASKQGVIIQENLWEQIVRWINLNLKGLYMLWNDEISTADFILIYMQKIS